LHDAPRRDSCDAERLTTKIRLENLPWEETWIEADPSTGKFIAATDKKLPERKTWLGLARRWSFQHAVSSERIEIFVINNGIRVERIVANRFRNFRRS